jgi:predicted RNA-binding protein YlxR (DUF448 family)
MLSHAPIEDADTGPRKSGTERLCVATREVKPIGEMIRFVAGPEGIVPDLKRKLPGRGVWVTAHAADVASAVKNGAFRRSLKGNAHVPPDLANMTERLLVRAALDALSIAHKAGAAVTGFGRVEAAIAAGGIRAVIHAAQAGDDGVRKLAGALARHGGHAEIAMVRSFTADELDLALGRSNVIHAALLANRASETFIARWRELERFRLTEPKVRGWESEASGAQVATAPQPRQE